MSTIFDLHHVDVQYGHVSALSQVTLQIRAGERVALVGANGSGKSTLLRLLHRLVTPTRGSAQCMDRACQAMLFQRPYMLRTSVQNQITIALWLRGRRWRDARALALQALARVEMAHLAGRHARALSGGQQQRLALAQAWAARPDVLLLDEPTASLDPRAKREVETLMDEFAQPRDGREITMIFSSHNLAQVRRLASRVIYLEHGRVVVDLPIDQFFSGSLPESAHLFVTGELL